MYLHAARAPGLDLGQCFFKSPGLGFFRAPVWVRIRSSTGNANTELRRSTQPGRPGTQSDFNKMHGLFNPSKWGQEKEPIA